jgi:hypothetical protein
MIGYKLLAVPIGAACRFDWNKCAEESFKARKWTCR